jgi:hypothetical protein
LADHQAVSCGLNDLYGNQLKLVDFEDPFDLGEQRFGLHLQIYLGIDIRGVEGDVAEPCADRIDVDTSAKKIG